MSKCVLVFGVSGVGKTTACQMYVAARPGVLYVSASSLLRMASMAPIEALRTAAADRIVENQALLEAAFRSFRVGCEDQWILVDAHGVIDNDRELVRVPVATVKAFDPERLVLLEASGAEVAARRLADARLRPIRSIEAIDHELTAERAAVENFACVLGVPLITAKIGLDFTLNALLDPIIVP